MPHLFMSFSRWAFAHNFRTVYLYVYCICVWVLCMSNITIRVPDNLKRQMEEHRDVNWSDVARKAFEETIQQQEMKRASKQIRTLRELSDPDWDGSAEIRKWRDAQK